ncbi:myb DNA-binding protein domain containing protein [Sporothrix schenckii 1099-18]|uniref:Myb DNA-binding protein domain containing protein n=1 Tax=Sporothrix schenckii 1099-18 TaxID=1397361 RepID=A0A0F2M834_SPOSC|nr:myb DNA-binding protein domain containing protein [Sporothrix schenckii 1099-18]KJR85244.1 myb DNA-binding protein domain containing protein [Sporothrix schenckii 1099-18]
MAANTMATIEPRLMHLLNVNDDRDHLPSIHSTLGVPDSHEDAAALMLPPLELNSPESSAGKQSQQQQQQQYQKQHHHHQQAGLNHSTLNSAFSPSSGGDDPSLGGSGGAGGWANRPLRMFLGDGSASLVDPFMLPGGADDPSSSSSSHMGKRPHVVPHTEELIHLPQPLKKQKSSQQVGSLNQVFPPIINGLHEPPPNAAVFPPIAYAEYDGDESTNRNADYGGNSSGGGTGSSTGGGSGGHYLFDSMLSGGGLHMVSDHDRMGEAMGMSSSTLPLVGGRHFSASSATDLSPKTGKATKKSPVSGRPARAPRSTRSTTGEAGDSPEAASSTNSAKPKRRATKPRRRWTEEETNQLLIGVSRHGLGKWTAILEDPEFEFSSRTAGDLKDRFRTCCPEELRGKLSRNDPSGAASPPDASTPLSSTPGPSTASGQGKSKTSLSLEDILTEPDEQLEAYNSQGQDGSPGSALSPDQPKMRKRRVHRRNMEDMIKLGIQGPFKKSHRRERRPFTEQDDKEILEGLQIYGPAWTKIHRHPSFNLASRQPTDLRDRVRNKYPDIYANIEKGVFQGQPEGS